MKNLFLSPRASETAYENFKSTLAKGRKVSDIKDYLSNAELKQLGGAETVFVWGAQPSLKSKWDKMSVGDYVLFYANGMYVTAAEVQLLKYDEKLALKLWPKSKDTGEPWSCLYFVKNLRQTRLPIEEFNSIAGYNMPILRGFQRVTKDHRNKIVANYGNLERFVESISTGLKDFELGELNRIASKNNTESEPGDLEKIDTIFGDRDPEDVLAELSTRNMEKTPEERITQQTRIVRDYKLVKALKEKHRNHCQICDFTFKTKSGKYYSEAAHIKPIATRDVGVDTIENILILCPNHHKMLDYGAIKIISKNVVEVEGKMVSLD